MEPVPFRCCCICHHLGPAANPCLRPLRAVAVAAAAAAAVFVVAMQVVAMQVKTRASRLHAGASASPSL